MRKLQLLSGRVKKTAPTSADTDRYTWLDLKNAEPDLGVPSADNYLITSDTNGTRSWLTTDSTWSGLSISSGDLTVNEDTVYIDLTGFVNDYTVGGVNQNDLHHVLEVLDNNLGTTTANALTAVVTDSTIDGNGTVGNALSIGQGVRTTDSPDFAGLSVDSSGSGYTFPTSDGNDGEYLITDGSGSISFKRPIHYGSTQPTDKDVGDLWYDNSTSVEDLFVWSGTQWESTTAGVSSGAFTIQQFNGDGSTTQFDTSSPTTNKVLVFLNGVLLRLTDDFTWSNGIVTFQTAPMNGDKIEVLLTGDAGLVGLDLLGIENHDLITVDSSGNVTFQGELDMGNNKIVNLATPTSNTDAATKAYVDSAVGGASLSGAADTGTVTVDLDSQTLTVAGTANEIETSATGQTITVGLPDSVSISSNLTLGGELRGPASFTIDPAAVGDDTGEVIIKGNLTIEGTTTTINSTELSVDDLNITIASGAANAAAADGAGITVDGASATIEYAATGDKWVFNKAPYYSTTRILTTDDLTGSDNYAFKTIAVAGTNLEADSNTDTLTITAAQLDSTDGIVLTPTAGSDSFTIAHANTSSVSDVSNTTNTFIGGQTYDTYGHVLTNTTASVNFAVSDNFAYKSITDGTNTAVASSNTDTFKIRVQDQIEATVANDDATHGDNVLFGHADSGVTAGTYGGTTAIPVITVDDQGHITSASTSSVTSSWSITDGSTTQVIDNGDTLTVVDGTDINAVVSATDTLTVNNTSTLHTVTGRGAQTTNKVGIGTTGASLNWQLHVERDGGTGNSQLMLLRNPNSTYSQSFSYTLDTSKNLQISGASGNGGIIWDAGINGFVWKVSTTQVGKINTTGLSVGSHAPSVELDVRGSGATTALVGSTGGTGAILVLDGNSNGDGAGGDYAYIEHSGTTGDLRFFNNNSASGNYRFYTQSSSQRFTLLNNGNVGISSNTPTNRLSVVQPDDTTHAIKLWNNTGEASVVGYGASNIFVVGPVTDDNMNVGIQASGSSKLNLYTNASAKVTVLAGGNVGVGTTTPIHLFHVYGSSSGSAIVGKIENGSTNQARLDLKNSEGNFGLISDSGEFRIYDNTDAALRMIVDTNGYVGIGTNAPQTSLQVASTDKTRAPIVLQGPVTNGQVLLAHNYLGSNEYHWTMGMDYSTNAWMIGSGVYVDGATSRKMLSTQDNYVSRGAAMYVDGSAGVIDFYTSNTSTTRTKDAENTDITNRMRIAASGYVGIGTVSPQTNLHVNGAWVANYGTLSIDGPENGLAGIGIRGNSTYQGSLIWRDGTAGNHLELTSYNSNPLYLKTDNVERISITGTGKVGIGTTTPDELLHVRSTTANFATFESTSTSNGNLIIDKSGASGNPNILFQGAGANKIYLNVARNDSDKFKIFTTSPSELARFTVQQNGNIGIGTESPTGILDVYRSQNASTEFLFRNPTSGTASRTRIIASSDTGAGNLSMGMHSSTHSSYPNQAWVWASGTSTPLVLATQGTPRVTISAAGNLGIGHTDPQRKLTVRADSTGGLTAAAFYNADTTDGNGSVFSFRSDTDGTGASTFVEFSAITGDFVEHDHATRKGALQFFTVHNGTGANRMTVASDGKVGIGTETPDEKLHVKGNIVSENAGSGAGIYTFSKTILANDGVNAAGDYTKDIFSISNQHGAQVYTVMFNCSTSGMSVAKHYTVVHAHGATPITNLTANTGAYSGHDFSVTFTNSNSNTGNTCTIENLSTSIDASITITVILGGAPTDVTVTAL